MPPGVYIRLSAPSEARAIVLWRAIRNHAAIEVVSVLPDERRYEEPLSGAEAAAAVGAFVVGCAKPHLGADVQIQLG